PEQIRVFGPEFRDRPPVLEARSDIYALGVILYQLLAGEHPFGPNPADLPPMKQGPVFLERIPHGAAPLKERNPQVPALLAQAITRCLAFDPADRFASAGDLVQTLKQCLPAPVKEVPLPRRRPLWKLA